MKKWIAAAGLAVILASSVSAAEPTTLTDKADKLDSVIFGDRQARLLSVWTRWTKRSTDGSRLRRD